MFEDMGYTDAQELDAVTTASRPYIERGLADGSYRGWVAEKDGTVVAGGGIVIHPWVAHPRDPAGRRAYILNVFTEPDCRRHGLAKRIMEIMVDWCRRQGFGTVSLHASDEGRPLYDKLGFKATNEMRLVLS